MRKSQVCLVKFIYSAKKSFVGDFMDITTHELIKAYLMKNGITNEVKGPVPNFWFKGPVPNFWFEEPVQSL
ncbi:MAG: hypothetical protein APG12_00159 [Candidatus Methanofastidiosum methylothiophilum]|uniref:Uncharacterized protein n=1 Tax=Candidatus Methanofastidiosum methylothiophilum TaxID=1705564 RepID=A0A150IMI6_9EURY|nr:MAG: hypothetical protein APG10_00106 [Candidatus Methanofastidiosum methylthiophilus]KYC47108.1 MAG: hypothetical protein APG11_01417 [Candidatus Methanofastidiosum methylthiophilus]KYC51234.1 MAG: hypothetical protein APG12_00159 [Candidatus Methanofastidiosum methylthiophilus]